MLLDHSSMRQRLLIAPLTCTTAALFLLASHTGTGAESIFGGHAKLPLAFALGATAAPSIYLVGATTVTRHAGSKLAPTVSSLCDMIGYSGNVILLWIGPGDQGVAGSSMLRTTGLYACCNAALVTALYVLEARWEHAQEKPVTARAKQLTEPLLRSQHSSSVIVSSLGHISRPGLRSASKSPAER